MIQSFPISFIEFQFFKNKALYWADQYSAFLLMDNNGYHHIPHHLEWQLGVSNDSIVCKNNELLKDLAHAQSKQKLFGHVSYDYGRLLFKRMPKNHRAFVPVSYWSFFKPEVLITYNHHEVEISSAHLSPEVIWQQIVNTTLPERNTTFEATWQQTKSREEYVRDIAAIKEHILNGDCYELNYCVEQRTHLHFFDPLCFFIAYNKEYPAPFASCYKHEDCYVCSASPERFLTADDKKIFAQPIKGTAARGKTSNEDLQAQRVLRNSKKDKAEHVMIVDLMRNDLSKCSEIGSVNVEELYGIYSFPNVHQMISTISGCRKTEMNWGEIMDNCFPMGSMTGAPKLKVMQLIDQYEGFSRGLFSGCLGYITDEGHFDFNVLIRSLFYDKKSGKLSYASGGAITMASNAEEEYEEMLLKASGIRRILAEM